jgi:hypothetical protein
MTDDSAPKYDVTAIEAVVIEEAADLHPQRLADGEMRRRIVSDIDDEREVDTVTEAIRNLREFGLLAHRDDVVEPTQAALRAVALLTR